MWCPFYEKQYTHWITRKPQWNSQDSRADSVDVRKISRQCSSVTWKMNECSIWMNDLLLWCSSRQTRRGISPHSGKRCDRGFFENACTQSRSSLNDLFLITEAVQCCHCQLVVITNSTLKMVTSSCFYCKLYKNNF